MEDEAVALNVAVVAPAETANEAGTVSSVLLLDSVTVDPPVGAACVRVTVHVLTTLATRLFGLQDRLETAAAVPVRLRIVVPELLPRVAVSVAL